MTQQGRRPRGASGRQRILSLAASVAVLLLLASGQAVAQSGDVRAWGAGGFGRLGYGNTNRIGDDETPALGQASTGFDPIDLSGLNVTAGVRSLLF